MKLVSDTPLTVGWQTWAFSPTDMRLIVVVKATVDLPREGTAQLAPDLEQVFVTGDELWGEDVERSVRYDSDLALLKPQGEVWITGTLRTGRPVRELSCRGRVGQVDMRFSVIGDRWWGGDGAMSEPEPFTSMELSWERAFGGRGMDANPVGRGIAPDPNDPEGRIAMPNIEHHCRLIRSPGDRPAPTGAFPIPRTWPERMCCMGTYDQAYVRERWPYFPEDFSYAHFQAARASQRVAGYWRGDEEIELIHLHPTHTRLSCRLPSIRPRAFVRELVRPEALREVGLLLDTIAIDVGEGRAHLIWRGSTPCSGEALSELSHLYVSHESIDQPRAAEHHVGAFRRRLRETEEESRGFEAEEAPPPSTSDAGLAEPAEIMEPPPGMWTSQELREQVQRMLGEGESLAGISAAEADLSLVDLSGQDLSGALLSRADLRGANLEGAMLDGATLDEARLAGASFRGASLQQASLALVQAEGADFTGAMLDGVRIERAMLGGAVFREARVNDASIEECFAVGADFRGAQLERTILRRSTLDEADFAHAKMGEAAIQGASLRRARLDHIDAAGLRAGDGADLSDASVRWANLAGASFADSVLTGTRFTESELTKASFCRAQLDGAQLLAVQARGAAFSDASMTAATLAGSDLLGARFEGARLGFADLSCSNLYRADFWRADLTEARLDGANVEGTKLA